MIERTLECDFGVGVEPGVDSLAESGIGIDNGILVDEYCRTTVFKALLWTAVCLL